MATPQGTSNYFKRCEDKALAKHGTRTFGRTGFHVSAIGFGGYRIDLHDQTHRDALRHALRNGVNLIDTSSNYADGNSELLVGEVLKLAIRDQQIHRDEVVIVTKAGYVQGKNLELTRQREAEERPFPDMVKYTDTCWHCIHPDFLEDQLMHSLQRLQQDCIDVYLLHNPEYFLADARQKGREDLEAVRDAYYERISLAFDWMEEKVSEGLIQWYGVSSNTFPAAADDPEFTSLERLCRAAESVAADHHFAVIQFPLNLFETEAATTNNKEGGTRTLLDLARTAGLATLVNRPLNAVSGNRMVRLIDFRAADPAENDHAFETRQAGLAAAEARFRNDFLPMLPEQLPRRHLEQVFTLSKQLGRARESFDTWENWDQVRQTAVLPQIQSILGHLNQILHDRAGWHPWARDYLQALDAFLDTVSLHYETRAHARSRKLAARLDHLAPGLADTPTLSGKALRVVSSLPAIDCVLLGMRRQRYVDDALTVLRQPALSQAEAVIKESLASAIQ